MRDRKINGIQHITITSNDLEVTDKFYTEVMGFIKIDRPEFDFNGNWYMINKRSADQQLHVIEDKWYIPDIEDIYPVDHVAFEAEGYGEMLNHLRYYDVKFTFEERKNKQMQIFFYDPNGVQIELNYKKSSEWT
tara:strand:+ start:218 stop:619 length:402 start_codon:yes stop_codon:yes gene_type:complete